MPPPLEALGPWPVEDSFGMRIAISIVLASQGSGKNVASYTQYDSIRKIGSAYGNHYEATTKSALNT